MSSILYREGKGTVEHGIVCESTICEADEVAGLLALGWLSNPPGYVPPEPVVAEDDVDPVDGDEIDGLKSELDAQIDSLKEQNRILTELDEASKTEIQRLTAEVERLTGELGTTGYDLSTAQAALSEMTEERDALISSGAQDGDETNLNPVRLAAKEKGIEGWDTKRLATLQAALDALESEEEA